MIKEKKYIPIIKTGEAEIKALSSLDKEVKNFMLPLFEITRGRKLKNADEGVIDKKIEFLAKEFRNNVFVLDLTSEANLSNTEIDKLHSSEDNYAAWVTFCVEKKSILGDFYPVIQIEEEEDYDLYINKLYSQVKTLSENFKYIVFRSQNEMEAKDLITDIKKILDQDQMNELKLTEKIIYVLDYKYINNVEKSVGTASTFVKVLKNIGINNVVLSSTSFPSNVSDHMSTTDYITFQIKELDFFIKTKASINSDDLNLVYSDYASINPIRNDSVFARGWIPRIDVPSLDKNIHCLRKRRNKTDNYADTYFDVAKNVINKKYFTDLLNKNMLSWGLSEIWNAANNNVGGSAPRFWISVRMNIYLKLMEQQLVNFIGL